MVIELVVVSGLHIHSSTFQLLDELIQPPTTISTTFFKSRF